MEPRRHGHFDASFVCGRGPPLLGPLVHQRLVWKEGRQDVKDEMAGLVPAPILAFIDPLVVRSQCANLQGHGLARLPEEDIWAAGQADLRALASLRVTPTYILGTKDPTVYDSDVYAFVSHLFLRRVPGRTALGEGDAC
jgi:hypothetical protein